MKIACVFIPHFATALERRRDPSLEDQPVIIVGASRGVGRVLDCSPEAAACGVAQGMALREAEALCPQAAVLQRNPDRYEAAFETFLEALTSFTPRVEPGELGWAYMEISELRSSSFDDAHLCQEIGQAVLERTGLLPSLGVARTRFAAYLVASSIGVGKILVLKPGMDRQYIGQFPISYLPMKEESKRRLSLLGIERIGQFAALPLGSAIIHILNLG